MIRLIPIACIIFFSFASTLYAQGSRNAIGGSLLGRSPGELLRGGNSGGPPGDDGNGPSHPKDRDRHRFHKRPIFYPLYGGDTYYIQNELLYREVYLLPEAATQKSKDETDNDAASEEEMRVEAKEWFIDDNQSNWQVTKDTLFGTGDILPVKKDVVKKDRKKDQIFGGGTIAD